MKTADFIELWDKLKAESGQLTFQNIQVFNNKDILKFCEKFVIENPAANCPLKKIIFNIHFSKLDDLDSACGDFAFVLPDIRALREDFLAEIEANFYLPFFFASKVIQLVNIIFDCTDSISFIYNFSSLKTPECSILINELRKFYALPILEKGKIAFKNFPFCFLPPRKYKYLYTHIIRSLKGNVFLQREFLQRLSKKNYEYLPPCKICRRRKACYTYTEIAKFPDYEKFLIPQTEASVVFAGPSVPALERPHQPDILYASPCEQGDIFMAIWEGFQNILIIDGYSYYDYKYPCTTFEVMLALENNINVFGSSGVGALRAVELNNYGMKGIGWVYDYLKRQEIKPYYVIAQNYGERDKDRFACLADIVYFLESALKENIISPGEFDKSFALASSIHFLDISFKYFLAELKRKKTLPQAVFLNLKEYFLRQGADSFNVKRKDAALLLDSFKNILKARAPDYVKNVFYNAKIKCLRIIYGKYHCRYNLALPESWNSFPDNREQSVSPPVSRDRREVSALETLKLVKEFFEGLDVVVANTVRRDIAGGFIINIFFIPFYFLERGVSSAAGTGDILEEVLVSAYMELLERIPLYGFNIPSIKPDEICGDIFPHKNLPQYYNWDVPEEVKLQTIKDLGYIKATDILTGRDIFIPKFSAMLSSDGNASGNSLREAILYGIYELIERDVLRTYKSISGRLKSKLIINTSDIRDERCRIMIKILESKGCKIVLYSFLNIYELPCVTCDAYDLNNRIKRRGGTAARADFDSALFNCLLEAYMGYITDFVGIRDDFRSIFEAGKNLRLIFEQEQFIFSKSSDFIKIDFPEARFNSVADELDFAVKKLTGAGIKNIIVLDNSPIDKFKLKSVKVIIPGMDLITINPYRPSVWHESRVRQTIYIANCFLG